MIRIQEEHYSVFSSRIPVFMTMRGYTNMSAAGTAATSDVL